MTEHSISLEHLAAQVRGHSIFSPSGSKLWLNCSGGLIPNVLAPDTAGREAAEGTVAHGVGEMWLKTDERPDHLVGTTEKVIEGDQVFEIEIDESMLGYVQVYYDWCACLPGEHLVEQRVDFSDLTPIPNQGGTADHIVLSWQRAIVTDLKYGVGVKVYAEGNTQALLYAYGVFRAHDWLYDIQEIEIRICQPRLDHLDTWTITRAELLEFAAYAKQRAYLAWAIDAPRAASEDACLWCKVKNDCGARVALVARMSDDVFDNLEMEVTADEMGELKSRLDDDFFTLTAPTVFDLTLEQKVAVFNYASVIYSCLEDIKADINTALKQGIKVPGWKLVQGRSSRDFTTPSDAHAELEFLGLTEDEIAPRTMISPAQAEELLVKQGYKRKMLPELIGHVIRKSPGGPTMVRESDKRPALSAADEGVFEDLDNPDSPETDDL